MEDERKTTLVVNLFGAPSAGKSTGAAYIFSMLKLAGINAELVTEFAKDKVWEGNESLLKDPMNQCYIFGKQFYKQNRCVGKVDVIVTDSPLPLSVLYNTSEVLGDAFNTTVMNCFNSFKNFNVFVCRNKKYNPSGRMQTEEESDALSGTLLNMLKTRNISYSEIKGDINGYNQVVKQIQDMLRKNAK